MAVVAAAGCGSSASKSAGDGSKVKTTRIELVKTGCSPSELTLPEGRTKFDVENIDADAIDEFEILDGAKVVGEIEQIAPGLSKSFTVTLKPGTFVLWCPGGSEKDGKGTLEVTTG